MYRVSSVATGINEGQHGVFMMPVEPTRCTRPCTCPACRRWSPQQRTAIPTITVSWATPADNAGSDYHRLYGALEAV